MKSGMKSIFATTLCLAAFTASQESFAMSRLFGGVEEAADESDVVSEKKSDEEDKGSVKERSDAAGVVLYSEFNSELYVLMAEYRSGKYTFMRGSQASATETPSETASRELDEETMGSYKIPSAALESSHSGLVTYASKSQGNTAHVFFYKAIGFVPANDMRKARVQAFGSDRYKFRIKNWNWIKLADLTTAVGNDQESFDTLTPANNKVTMELDHYALAILKQAHKDGVLQGLK